MSDELEACLCEMFCGPNCECWCHKEGGDDFDGAVLIFGDNGHKKADFPKERPQLGNERPEEEKQ